jgi:prolyl 4-hydroxylase
VGLFYTPVAGATLSRARRELRVLHPLPNVFVVERFLLDREVDHLLLLLQQRSRERQMKRSYMNDSQGLRVVSDYRTSHFTWLGKQQDAIVRSIEERAAGLLSVATDYLEPLQLISYTQGQEFKLHHDTGTLEEDGSISPVFPKRTATIFCYLNTLPEGVGHTAFPALGSSVQPLRGRAVVFPNLQPDGHPEPLTVHAAEAVHGHIWKFGLNIWASQSSHAHAALGQAPKARRRAARRPFVQPTPGQHLGRPKRPRASQR